MHDIPSYHTSPEDAARIAQQAGVRQLVFYHDPRPADRLFRRGLPGRCSQTLLRCDYCGAGRDRDQPGTGHYDHERAPTAVRDSGYGESEHISTIQSFIDPSFVVRILIRRTQ